jgi:hypothetical protein
LWNWTNWVVDADIKGFFDNVDHEWLMKFLEHDIEDKNFLRYIKRFLKAGIMEEGKYYYNYYGIIGNYAAMNGFRAYVLDRLKATLNRRGANRDLTVERFLKLLNAYPVVRPRIVHRV